MMMQWFTKKFGKAKYDENNFDDDLKEVLKKYDTYENDIKEVLISLIRFLRQREEKEVVESLRSNKEIAWPESESDKDPYWVMHRSVEKLLKACNRDASVFDRVTKQMAFDNNKHLHNVHKSTPRIQHYIYNIVPAIQELRVNLAKAIYARDKIRDKNGDCTQKQREVDAAKEELLAALKSKEPRVKDHVQEIITVLQWCRATNQQIQKQYEELAKTRPKPEETK